MKSFQNIFLVLSAVLILLPSAISFAHIFSSHGHQLCDNYSESHYHAKPVDCDLYKFHKTPGLQLEFLTLEPVEIKVQQNVIFNYYQFLSDYQKLPFEQRGPPQHV
ncbi:hypothetical protein [Autumnicola psychrophila]|uniref:Uncharacterized protein n=1 Tax=Autumnicola psychrophila TaxID=3075592 RepID=A0ABU3DPG8_9FLAO|nr:hypothetical protein [Zunongwangia sp. F225]MDT0685606.1 hypothetical protein [Zunongwangia sp. F225]